MGMMTPGGPVRSFVIVLMTVAALALTSGGGGSEPQELVTAAEFRRKDFLQLIRIRHIAFS